MASASQYSPNTVDELKNKAKQTYDDAADRVQDMASDARQMANDARRQLTEVGGNVKGAVDKSIKDQPMTTLFVAAALGFVIGALWKS